VRVVSNNPGVGAAKMPTVARFAATHCVTYKFAEHSQHQSLNPNTYTIFNQTQDDPNLRRPPQKGIYPNPRKNMLQVISRT